MGENFKTRTGDTKPTGRDLAFPTVPGGGPSGAVARAALTDTTDTTLVAAPTGGKSIYVTAMTGSNAGASLSTVDVKDGATAKFSFSCAANGGGFAVPLPQAWKLTADTALKVQQSASVALAVSVIYYVE